MVSCSPESAPASEATQAGEPAELGSGRVATCTTVDPDGNLTALGVRLDAALVSDPPTEPDGTAPCYLPDERAYTISLEGFVRREAE